MNRMQHVAWAVALLGAVVVAAPAAAQTQMADVLGIEIVGTAGDLQIVQEEFIPAPGGHLTLDTLAFRENASSAQPDPDPLNNLWWDVEITVEADPTAVDFGTMVSIDKDVINNTPFHWTDFHMTLGMGTGPNFMESDEFDNLYFKNTPGDEPQEKSGAFPNPPMVDEPNAPDSLWWLQDANTTGVDPGGMPIFWLAINIPPGKFVGDPTGGPARATFTLRQHASIPEPGSMALAALAVGGMGVIAARRRRGC